MKERFGSKSLRIFRLILLKTMLEQKQVADVAMIPGKEAKELLYTLLAEGFVSLQVAGGRGREGGGGGGGGSSHVL